MQDQLPEVEKLSGEEKATFAAIDSYQTPVEAESRKTSITAQTNAKPTAVPEFGSSDQLTEGGGN